MKFQHITDLVDAGQCQRLPTVNEPRQTRLAYAAAFRQFIPSDRGFENRLSKLLADCLAVAHIVILSVTCRASQYNILARAPKAETSRWSDVFGVYPPTRRLPRHSVGLVLRVVCSQSCRYLPPHGKTDLLQHGTERSLNSRHRRNRSEHGIVQRDRRDIKPAAHLLYDEPRLKPL
jgi:hypothetical protein